MRYEMKGSWSRGRLRWSEAAMLIILVMAITATSAEDESGAVEDGQNIIQRQGDVDGEVAQEDGPEDDGLTREGASAAAQITPQKSASTANSLPGGIPATVFVRDVSIRVRGSGEDAIEEGIEVFRDSSLDLSWFKCAIPGGMEQSFTCHFEDEFADRLTFDINLEYPQHFELHKATVKEDGGHANPEVIGHNVDSDNSHSEFTVVYNCFSPGNIRLEVNVPYTYHLDSLSREVVISFSWIHRCETGINEYVHLLYIDERSSGVAQEFREDQVLTFNRRRESTHLLLALSPPARSQGYGAPKVTSSSENVKAALVKGGAGVIYAAEQHSIVVAYECHSNETADISLEVPLPPFDPLVATWKKDCNEFTEANIRILASPSEIVFYDSRSVVQPPEVTVPRNQTYMDFEVINKDEVEAVLIKPIMLSAERQNVVYPWVQMPGFEESLFTHYVPPGGMLLRPSSKVYLRVRFTCKSSTTSQVSLSIPFKSFDPAEFTLQKQCQHLPRRRYASLIGGLGVMGCFLAVLMLGGLILTHQQNWSPRGMHFAERFLRKIGRLLLVREKV